MMMQMDDDAVADDNEGGSPNELQTFARDSPRGVHRFLPCTSAYQDVGISLEAMTSEIPAELGDEIQRLEEWHETWKAVMRNKDMELVRCNATIENMQEHLIVLEAEKLSLESTLQDEVNSREQACVKIDHLRGLVEGVLEDEESLAEVVQQLEASREAELDQDTVRNKKLIDFEVTLDAIKKKNADNLWQMKRKVEATEMRLLQMDETKKELIVAAEAKRKEAKESAKAVNETEEECRQMQLSNADRQNRTDDLRVLLTEAKQQFIQSQSRLAVLENGTEVLVKGNNDLKEQLTQLYEKQREIQDMANEVDSIRRLIETKTGKAIDYEELSAEIMALPKGQDVNQKKLANVKQKNAELQTRLNIMGEEIAQVQLLLSAPKPAPVKRRAEVPKPALVKPVPVPDKERTVRQSYETSPVPAPAVIRNKSQDVFRKPGNPPQSKGSKVRQVIPAPKPTVSKLATTLSQPVFKRAPSVSSTESEYLDLPVAPPSKTTHRKSGGEKTGLAAKKRKADAD